MTEREFEFMTEIPDGSSIKAWGGYVFIMHPDHPLKSIGPDGRVEVCEPWPIPPNSPISATGRQSTGKS